MSTHNDSPVVVRPSPEEATAMHQILLPWVLPALGHAHGELDVPDLFALIASRQAQVWIVMGEQSKRILGVATTQVIVYPKLSALRIITLGGQQMNGWARALDTELVKFCKEHGLSRMEAYGRKGLGPKIAELAFVPAYTAYIKEIV